jgi:hypothetical protein
MPPDGPASNTPRISSDRLDIFARVFLKDASHIQPLREDVDLINLSGRIPKG